VCVCVCVCVCACVCVCVCVCVYMCVSVCTCVWCVCVCVFVCIIGTIGGRGEAGEKKHPQSTSLCFGFRLRFSYTPSSCERGLEGKKMHARSTSDEQALKSDAHVLKSDEHVLKSVP
jgi:hypothetical protein